ncbi:MAG TPA: endonuclease domain-containing protein [Herpetosiphonaceae bacterium]
MSELFSRRARTKDRNIRRWRMSQDKQERASQFRQAQTQAEDVLWERLRNRQIGNFKFRRQHTINGFIVDFCCLERDLVIEIDGPIHQQQIAYDVERSEVLQRLGYRVVRYTNEQVIQNIEIVLESIRQHLVTNE